MGKHAEKAHHALDCRRIAFDELSINARGDGKMRRPGSQNRKKGYYRRGRRR
jgi:hypothetical protein